MIFPRRGLFTRFWWASAPSSPGTPGNTTHEAEVTETLVFSDSLDRNIIAGKSVSEAVGITDVVDAEVVDAVPEEATVTLSDGGDLATASYTPLASERNKPPVIEDVVITSDTGTVQVDAILTATITAEIIGPYTEGEHEYQWYRADTIDGALTAIAGATSVNYIVQAADLAKYLIVRARFVIEGGANPTSEYMYSELTDLVAAAEPGGGGGGDGDITYDWADFFDIESGASVPGNWNTAGVSPVLTNLGLGADWTAADANKPTYDGVNGEMVFAGAHRITGYSNAWPAVYEVWVKATFTGGAGALLSQGNQIMFGTDASNNWETEGLFDQPGDLNEHVFRIVYNGANSIFQVDGGEEISFTDSSTSGSVLNLGCTNAGSSFGEFKIKRFQRTEQGQLLTAQQVSDKWAFHGFAPAGDINHAWADFLDIESGASISPTFNTDVDPVVANLGSRGDWTTVDTSKPTFDVDKLVFSGAHRVTGLSQAFPPVCEIWIKGRFTANNGAMIGWGSQTLFGMNSSNQFFVRDTSGIAVAGDLSEHVFRIVLNGASSILQIDGGAEQVFDENFTSASSIALGQTFGGANFADCEIKRFQRTDDGVLLTAQEVADKWAYHGF